MQFWTLSNFKWYLKYQLFLPGPPIVMEWDAEDPMLFRTTYGGTWHEVRFAWQYASSPDAASTVAVINGSNLLVSYLAFAQVPPPMCAFTLVLPAPILSVSFSSGLMLVTGAANSDKAFMALYTIAGKAEPTLRYILWSELFSSLRLLQLVSNSVVIGVCKSSSSNTDDIVEFVIGDRDGSQFIKEIFRTQAPGRIVAVTMGRSCVFFELKNGTVFSYKMPHADKSQIAPAIRQDFSYPCYEIAPAIFGDTELIVGLSSTNRLLLGKYQISDICTSFSLHPRFLIYSTLDSNLRIIPLYISFSPSDIGKLQQVWKDSSRAIERGASIVTVPYHPDSTLVILELPRGNLESVHPRALTIDSIRRLLNRKEYRTAMLLIRKHRIDPNFLCDNNFSAFLKDIDSIVDQISLQDHLSIFLSSLREENVATAMYQDPIQLLSGQVKPQKAIPNKVKTVCDALITVMRLKNYRKYANPIFTAYTSSTPPDLENGLMLIRQLYKEEANAKQILDPSADKVLEYALILVDVNKLFETALGLYDFDLVLMVAEKSQRDPKEYIPFLEELRQMPENYQRYTIDMHLKRYASALLHLSKCGDKYFDNCVKLTTEQKLYRQSLTIFAGNSERYNLFCELYGDYLTASGMPEQAAILYNNASKSTKAIACFLICGDWRSGLSVAHQAKYTKEQVDELVAKFVDYLENSMQYSEAAHVLELYTTDSHRILSCYLSSHSWGSALHCCEKYNIVSNVDKSPVKSAALDVYSEISEQINEKSAQLKRQCEKFEELEAMYNSQPKEPVAEAPQPQERGKRQRGVKKGKPPVTRTELELAASSISSLLDIESLRKEIVELLRCLVKIDCQEQAKSLQRAFTKYLEDLKSSIPSFSKYLRSPVNFVVPSDWAIEFL